MTETDIIHDGGRYHVETSPWFLYDIGLRHERVKSSNEKHTLTVLISTT